MNLGREERCAGRKGWGLKFELLLGSGRTEGTHLLLGLWPKRKASWCSLGCSDLQVFTLMSDFRVSFGN